MPFTNEDGLWCPFEARARANSPEQRRFSGAAPDSAPSSLQRRTRWRHIVERAPFSSGRDSCSIPAAEALEVALFLHSLFVGLNSLLSRIYSLFGAEKSPFVCAGNFRVSARNYALNPASNRREDPEFEDIPCSFPC